MVKHTWKCRAPHCILEVYGIIKNKKHHCFFPFKTHEEQGMPKPDQAFTKGVHDQ
jgi:hypothetical protein